MKCIPCSTISEHAAPFHIEMVHSINCSPGEQLRPRTLILQPIQARNPQNVIRSMRFSRPAGVTLEDFGVMSIERQVVLANLKHEHVLIRHLCRLSEIRGYFKTALIRRHPGRFCCRCQYTWIRSPNTRFEIPEGPTFLVYTRDISSLRPSEPRRAGLL